jgi:hypothetical protein
MLPLSIIFLKLLLVSSLHSYHVTEMDVPEPTSATVSDHDQYVVRLKWCIEKVGSAYALAKAAGINHSTLAKHISGSEPTRPFLNAIAKASEVRVGWLSEGIGIRDAERSRELKLGAKREPLAWIKDWNRPPGSGLKDLADATGIEIKRLGAILDRTEVPTIVEVLEISEHSKMSLFWLLLGSDPNRVVDVKSLDGQELTKEGLASDVLISATKLQVAIAGMLAPINRFKYFPYEIKNDFMSPPFERGDVLIADETSANITDLRGTFIVSDKGDIYACNLTPDRYSLKVSFNKPNLPSLDRTFDEPTGKVPGADFRVIGRVVYHLSVRSV